MGRAPSIGSPSVRSGHREAARTVKRKEIGARGEAAAARFLEGLGYSIRERNYRCGYGEIDLIATAEGFLVFVEVKTRSPKPPLHPSSSVNARKQAKVRQVGGYYLAQHPEMTLQPRFDVISIELGDGNEKVEHIVNAF